MLQQISLEKEDSELALTPAIRAGGKVSFKARVKAFSKTRLQAASLRCEARLPSSMVVFARMPGSSSTYDTIIFHGLPLAKTVLEYKKEQLTLGSITWSFARNLSRDWLRVFCESLGARTNMLFKVSSLRYALLSVNPVAT